MLIEAARLVQFKNQYTCRRAGHRLCALLASLRGTCESFLKGVGLRVPVGSGIEHQRMMKLLTETHVQHCMLSKVGVAYVVRLELESMVQLAHFIANEYIVEMRKHRLHLQHRHDKMPVVESVPPTPRLTGVLPRTGPSAFRAVSARDVSSAGSEAGTTDEGDTEDIGAEDDEDMLEEGQCSAVLSSESAGSPRDALSEEEEDESSEDEYEFCTNVDGKSEAQCQCYACFSHLKT